MVYCAGKLIENLKLFYKSNTFHGFTGSVITHLACWENTKKACKSLAFGSWFTSFSSALPTSCMGYHAGKPIENVIHCLNKLELKDIVSWEATCIKELGCCILLAVHFWIQNLKLYPDFFSKIIISFSRLKVIK